MRSPPALARAPMPAAALLVAALSACHKQAAEPPDPYAYTPPPAGTAPAGLDTATWTAHYQGDLLPYWTMAEAKGSPVGNFPTYRGMDGSLQGSTARKPRMMGRQIFAYSVGFMLTGDESLLDLARAGTRWLLDHGVDAARGGWYADLDAAGAPLGDGTKWAQDMAYDAMGPAAFFLATRDPEAEAAVLATRDLLFDPARYWDRAGGRIRDGMDPTLTSEVPVSAASRWELVAQLDPMTAFLMPVQPVLSDPARRDQVLGDLRTLALRIRDSFWWGGIFWGSTGSIGIYGSNHTDFGHILKAYWALRIVDGRLADRPLKEFLAGNAPATLRLAYDQPYGRWAKRPFSESAVVYGSDWWAYAESDQLAATLALHDPTWIPTLASTAANFRGDYVDRTRAAREVVPSVGRTGAWVSAWPDTDTAKCNEWKSGFHTSEHALVLHLFAHWLAGVPAPLYFAFPAAQAPALAAGARPYVFEGRVASVEDLGPLAGDPTRHKVRIGFAELR